MKNIAHQCFDEDDNYDYESIDDEFEKRMNGK